MNYKLEPSTKRYLEKQEKIAKHQREAFSKSPKSVKEIERGEKKFGKAISSIKFVPHAAKGGSSFLQRYAQQSGVYKK